MVSRNVHTASGLLAVVSRERMAEASFMQVIIFYKTRPLLLQSLMVSMSECPSLPLAAVTQRMKRMRIRQHGTWDGGANICQDV